MPKSGGFSSILLSTIVTLVFLIITKEANPVFKIQNRFVTEKELQEIQIEWQVELDTKGKKLRKFVEANPDTPQNSPDKEENFSFRDQQAAQPDKADPSKTNLEPEVKGTIESQKIVESSDKIEIDPLVTPLVNNVAKERGKNMNPQIEKQVNSQKDQKEIDQNDGFYSEKILDKRNSKKKLLSFSSPKALESSNIKNHDTHDHPIQKIRPKLSADLIHGPLLKSTNVAPRIGMIGIECRLHPYGVYVQKMMQSIEEQWNQLAKGSIQYLRRDLLPNQITLTFKLDSNGNISSLSRIDQEGYSLAAELCRQAIASRAPFGKWTEKMINDFGHTDQITINFRYL